MTGEVDRDEDHGLSDDEIDAAFENMGIENDTDSETGDESDPKDEDTDNGDTTGEEDPDAGDEDSESEGDKTVPLAALLAERQRTKEWKERAKALEEQQPKVSTDDPEPDRFEDPEGHDAWLIRQERRNRDAEAADQQKEFVESSREKAIDTHEDYIEMEQIFMMLNSANPELGREMLNSPDPGEFAYQKGKEWMDGKAATIRAQIEAELTAASDEDEDEPETTETKPKAKRKPSLATATAAARNEVNVEREESLEDVFNGQAY